MLDPKEKTILVVDDEPSIRQALVFDFKRRGFQVHEAGNGRDAFDIVQKNKIDLVISDIRMAGGDGVELLDNIKNRSPEIPVVMFITGYADLTLDEAYHRGADAVFAKPFNRTEFISAVMKTFATREERWSSKPAEGEEMGVALTVELRFEDLGYATQGKLMNLGRGGIYVALQNGFPSIGSKASFSIRFEKGEPASIEGSGTVRWVRGREDHQGPAGCGIEFDHLSDESRKQVIALLEQMEPKPKSFIPKT